jgi:hypothetical protein
MPTSKGPHRNLDAVDLADELLGDRPAGHDAGRLFVDGQDGGGLDDDLSDLARIGLVLGGTEEGTILKESRGGSDLLGHDNVLLLGCFARRGRGWL